MNQWLASAAMAMLLVAANVALADENPDPWEGFNRSVYRFNDFFDRYLLKPVAEGYVRVTPQPVRTGIGNFFSNLGEVTTVINDLLQGKFKQAGLDSTRFLVNTTVGLVGFIDVGSRIGLERNNEDFGQTLGYWGVESGPYLMLPFLGPSTVRDAAGLVPEYYYASPLELAVEEHRVRYGLYGVDAVDTRARLLDAEKMVAGDRYTFIREAYLQRRAFLVRDGALDDSFLDEDDDLFEDDEEEDEDF